MATITFDVAEFRTLFPEFSDPLVYPDATLEMYWDMAICYISDQDYGCLSGDCRKLALNLLTAHIARFYALMATGNDPAFVESATVDKVSVSRMSPAQSNQWNFWLNQTPYGQQLLALLKSAGIGGGYAAGLPERSAFRQVGGFFLN